MNFQETDTYIHLRGNIFRGLIVETGGVHIGGSGVHDRDEDYALEAGRLAFEVTGGDQQAGGIAMLLNARIGSEKMPLLQELLVDGNLTADENQALADNFLMDKDDRPINYRMIWDSNVQEKILERFKGFPKAQQVALLAHVCIVVGRLRDPVDPAPDFIQSSVKAFLMPLAALANKEGLEVLGNRLGAAYRYGSTVESQLKGITRPAPR